MAKAPYRGQLLAAKAGYSVMFAWVASGQGSSVACGEATRGRPRGQGYHQQGQHSPTGGTTRGQQRPPMGKGSRRLCKGGSGDLKVKATRDRVFIF
ncbi:hypothetical protein BHE74_00057599 [Ensete ventricosum]|nr:hypothetical protein BHE74_00057599 [Ensete ventricosum]RZR88613.1 hypothetical protein BHM03_00016235 [Ensete ventricosum]